MTRLFAILAIAVLWALPVQAEETAYDFTFTTIEGKDLPLSQFKGRPILVVNTATECGNTHQLGSLQKLWEAYKDQGLVVLGVPSNDFGQEPRGNDQIKRFCEAEYGAEFPMTQLTPVRGDDAHPFYVWALDAFGLESAPTWNFYKYLVGRDGKAVASWGTVADPMREDVRSAVENALAQ